MSPEWWGTSRPTLITLHSFSASNGPNDNGRNNDGGYPFTSLIQGSDGNFYGTTSRGGPGGNGTIFQFTPGGALTALHDFSALISDGANDDGSRPAGDLLQGSDDNFYGTTFNGGQNGAGTIFQITVAGALTTLHSFGAADDYGENLDGANPSCGLTEGSDGNFYGTTFAAGRNEAGTIFRITPAGELTTMYSFSNPYGGANSDGGSPVATLQRGPDGNFYGTTDLGGTGGTGTIFRITPAGNLTTLHSFAKKDSQSENADGVNPISRLLLGRDGNLYGTTSNGGSGGAGTVFQMTTAGVFTLLHQFTPAEAGGPDTSTDFPTAGLIERSDGDFYGTTGHGGLNGAGSIYRLAPTGTLNTLYRFGGRSDFNGESHGEDPRAGLLLGHDGNFYGTTAGGGTDQTGTIFLLTSMPATVAPVATLVTNKHTITAETGETDELVLSLSAPLDNDVVISLTILGSAINGTDYSLLKMSKKIKAGHTSRSIKIIPQGDLGGATKKVVRLGLAPGDGYIVGTTKVKVKIVRP